MVAAYNAVERAFYMKNNKPVVTYDLVVVRRSWVFERPLDKLFETMKKNRNLYRDKFTKPGGSVTVITVEPDRQGWRIQLSTIVSADPEDDPDLGQADVKRLLADKMTKRKLAMHVGWALRYPLGMMYGDVARTAQLLTTISTGGRSIRQFAAAGGMKNKSMREMKFR